MKRINSLSTKIVLSFTIISIFIILTIFIVLEKINKEAFYNIEIEKANIIARTIEPLIALNIYLDMDYKVKQITKQLIENPNILSVEIKKENNIIVSAKSEEFTNNKQTFFKINKIIHEPNSSKKLAVLTIIYSNKTYVELTDKYTKITIGLLIFLIIVFVLLVLYIKKLLSPLRKISKSLKSYSPNMKIDFPFIEQKNEIGLISNALSNMQDKISQYAKKQENINIFLEEQVHNKTQELRIQLFTDDLTKLPNRLSLIENVTQVENGSLLIVNIDDFKEINDFFGHVAGDKILIELSKNINNICSHKDDVILGRLSGDEFAILFIKKPSLKDFLEIANNLISYIEEMLFSYEENKISIGVTIGGAYDVDGALLEKADIALKLAKKQKKSFLLYDNNLNIEEQYKNNREWIHKLKKAMSKDNIVPYFQPIYDNTTGRIASAECLIRLIDDENNVISPLYFLDISKRVRLYSDLTKLMIKKSCQYFETLDCSFSVNISVEDMLDENMLDYIKMTIKEHNVATRIIFEILESEGIENYEEVSKFIDEMKLLGCKIAIDDFGSGYSNFEHLFKLNIDFIKIDGSLIKNIDTDVNAQIVIETIVSFANKLNILTIAEYVHNESIHKKVIELKIDRSQGFYLAKPQEKMNM